jgi:hypothetical protein
LTIIKNYYKSTNPDNGKLKKYIENTKVHNKLSNNESEKCEGEITIKECTNAIFKMKLNKGPGLDGFIVYANIFVSVFRRVIG